MTPTSVAGRRLHSFGRLGIASRLLWAPFGSLVLLFRYRRRPLFVLDHDALGTFNVDCDSLLLDSKQAGPWRPQTDYPVVLFPREVSNETCRRLFMREMGARPNITVLDSRESPSNHFVERLLRKLVRSNGRLPWFGLRLNSRVDGGTYEFAPGFAEPRPLIAFSNEEQRMGWEALYALGLSPTTKYVCFNVRDNAYTSQRYPNHASENARHDYRNPPPNNYVPAVRFLLEQGFFVVHMGKVVSDRFPVDHPRFLHYASSKHHSDFLDVFLYAHCEFALQGSGSGVDSLASIFNRPLCTTDAIPLSYFLYWPSNTGLRVVVPALLRDVDSGRFLSCADMANKSFTESAAYEEAGLTIVANSPEEILEATKFTLSLHIDWDDSTTRSFPGNVAFWTDFVAAICADGESAPPKSRACGKTLLIPESFIQSHAEELLPDSES